MTKLEIKSVKTMPRQLVKNGTLVLEMQGYVVAINPTEPCFIFNGKTWRKAKGQDFPKPMMNYPLRTSNSK